MWDGRYFFSAGHYNHLYDHETDPYETTNLLDSDKHKGVRQEMSKLLIQLAEETGDPDLPAIQKGL